MIDELFLYLEGIPKKLLRMNKLLLLVQLTLLGFGLLFIYSAGQQTGGRIQGYWIRQLVWAVAGGGLMVAIMGLDYRVLGRFSLLIFLFAMGLLVAVLLLGQVVNGAKSWLKLLPGVAIQPAEFAKLGLIVPLAWYASFESTDFKRYRDLAYCCALTAIPMFLILLQPDLGSALVFGPVCLVVLFVGGMRTRLLVYAVMIGLLAGPLVYKFGFKYHQKQRVLTYLKPILSTELYFVAEEFSISEEHSGKDSVVTDDWNARQSALAVGSGGLYGKGFGKGTQNTLGFLPKKVAPTDFIFSVIAEETGFMGSMILIGAYVALLFLCVHIGARARDDFGRYMALAIGAMFCVHIFINIGMTIRVMPIIGIPLPFVSYGGSGMIGMMASMGVLQSIHIHRNEELRG